MAHFKTLNSQSSIIFFPGLIAEALRIDTNLLHTLSVKFIKKPEQAVKWPNSWRFIANRWQRVKSSLCLNTTSRRWLGRRKAPRILNLGTRLRLAVSDTLRPLYPRGKSSRYPSDTRMGGHQRKSLSLPGNETPSLFVFADISIF